MEARRRPKAKKRLRLQSRSAESARVPSRSVPSKRRTSRWMDGTSFSLHPSTVLSLPTTRPRRDDVSNSQGLGKCCLLDAGYRNVVEKWIWLICEGGLAVIQRSLFSRVSRQQIPIARRGFLTSSAQQGK